MIHGLTIGQCSHARRLFRFFKCGCCFFCELLKNLGHGNYAVRVLISFSYYDTWLMQCHYLLFAFFRLNWNRFGLNTWYINHRLSWNVDVSATNWKTQRSYKHSRSIDRVELLAIKALDIIIAYIYVIGNQL